MATISRMMGNAPALLIAHLHRCVTGARRPDLPPELAPES